MEPIFCPYAAEVGVYDFLEMTILIPQPDFGNPFTDVEVLGHFSPDTAPFEFTYGLPGNQFGQASNAPSVIPVEGFCDSPDGRIYRIRYMPDRAGKHIFTLTLRHRNQVWMRRGEFSAILEGRKGPLRADEAHPFHFKWEGTEERFFYNGMTAYHLPGVRDEDEIEAILDRYRHFRVNRLRMGLSSSRVESGMAWFEPVHESDRFTFNYGPWAAERPEDAQHPGWDAEAFDVAYWRKVERILAMARERNIVVSVIMYVDAYREGATPFTAENQGGEAERLYFRYAAARLAAYSNVMWDLTNEYRLVRSHEWVERMGSYLRSVDPYRHLTTCHGHGTFEFRRSGWADVAVYQSWDEHGGYDYMLNNRKLQLEAGRPMPQVNEEYGYEDHYPSGWGLGKVKPARSAERLRGLAWEIYMAGGYQTSGEYAGNGLGGWLNGRADESMKLPAELAKIVTFFESCAWWRTEPSPERVDSAAKAYCLAEPGSLYLLYLPVGGDVAVLLEQGSYEACWYDPGLGSFEGKFRIDSAGERVSIPGAVAGRERALRILRK